MDGFIYIYLTTNELCMYVLCLLFFQVKNYRTIYNLFMAKKKKGMYDSYDHH
jgi:hypothetical protein